MAGKNKAVRVGEGPGKAEIMLVGQNPGKEEVKQDRPFVGRAGKYLDKVLQESGLDRKSIYLTAAVRAPTPGNRRPTSEEIKRWMPCLLDEIRRIKPATVVLMGTVAWKTPRFKNIEYIETYHPAAAMRFPKIKAKFQRDMQELGRRVREKRERKA